MNNLVPDAAIKMAMNTVSEQGSQRQEQTERLY